MGMDAPLLSRTLGGRFKITGHIGEGAMASVFRGVDLNEGGAEIAVKVMHPHLASDRTFTARFKREAQAASMVKHPNTVTIIDVGEEQGTHYIIMELCRGRDLRMTLQAEQRLPAPRAAKIIMTILDALTAAHALGVVHRDLKPENVMIEHDPSAGTDRVKVLDFGIAKLVDAQPKVRVDATDSDPPPALTQMGVVVGTPQYMSPEQCRGQPLDGRSDLYTCGVLLYQLVTGQLPFNSESPFEVAGKQAFEPPPPPSTHLPSIDPELEGIILRTLSKPPADRPQSAAELKGVLEQWVVTRAGNKPAGAPPPPPNRAFGRTVPLANEAMMEARAAAERAAAGPARRDLPAPRPAAGMPAAAAAGPFKAAAAPAQPVAFDNPPTFDPHGPMGTVVAMEAVVAPPPRPAPPDAARMTPSRGNALAGLEPPKERPAFEPPGGLPPLEPPKNGAAAEAPLVTPKPAPVPLELAGRPTAAATAAAPAELPPEGWGIFGFIMILLSLGAGVGLGFALYQLQLF